MVSNTQPQELSDFPITRRWQPKNIGNIQVYTYGTPNGVKIPLLLEELGLGYDIHHIPLDETGVKSAEFLALNPNNKIPAIIDPNGPNNRPIGIFESAAILIYLSDKAGKFIGSNQYERYNILQWLMFQIGSVGPMLGQFGYFFIQDGRLIEDPRPLERYMNETKRILGVIDKQLSEQTWIAGNYSIADMAIGPWLQTIERFYKAGDELGLKQFSHLVDYLERFSKRPAVQKAWTKASAS